MCDKCPWEKALPLMQKLIDSRKAIWANSFIYATIVWVENHRHITNKQLAAVQKIERRAGIKKLGDYDVQESAAGSSRKRSGLFS